MEKNKWIFVENSNLISGYKYDGENFIVEFKSNRAMYKYYPVPESVANVIDADSPGAGIKHLIVDGGFEYKRIN
jgi:hypothetical protein